MGKSTISMVIVIAVHPKGMNCFSRRLRGKDFRGGWLDGMTDL